VNDIADLLEYIGRTPLVAGSMVPW